MEREDHVCQIFYKEELINKLREDAELHDEKLRALTEQRDQQ